MSQICPTCSKPAISFVTKIKASMPMGTNCPSCGTTVRVPLARRLLSSAPALAFIVFEFVVRPDMVAEAAGLLGVIFLVTAFIYVAPLEVVHADANA